MGKNRVGGNEAQRKRSGREIENGLKTDTKREVNT